MRYFTKDNYEDMVTNYIESNLGDLTENFIEKNKDFVVELIHNECNQWLQYATQHGLDDDDTNLDTVTAEFMQEYSTIVNALVQDCEKFDTDSEQIAFDYLYDNNPH